MTVLQTTILYNNWNGARPLLGEHVAHVLPHMSTQVGVAPSVIMLITGCSDMRVPPLLSYL